MGRGRVCLGSLPLASAHGRVDFVLHRTNPMCWNPDGGRWGCVAIPGVGFQGGGIDPGQPTFSGNGSVSVSVSFVAPRTGGQGTVLEPITSERGNAA